MSDSDECDKENVYGLQKYSLVRFLHKGRKRQIESVDIVPSKWIDFDKKRAKCVTKFLEGPYGDKDLQLIHDLVIANADAPEDWPTFSIEQVGRADTYEAGMQKLKRLEREQHVLTLESEDSASEAQRQLAISVKRRKLLAEANNFNIAFSSADTDQTEETADTFGVTKELQSKQQLKRSVGLNSEVFRDFVPSELSPTLLKSTPSDNQKLSKRRGALSVQTSNPVEDSGINSGGEESPTVDSTILSKSDQNSILKSNPKEPQTKRKDYRKGKSQVTSQVESPVASPVALRVNSSMKPAINRPVEPSIATPEEPLPTPIDRPVKPSVATPEELLPTPTDRPVEPTVATPVEPLPSTSSAIQVLDYSILEENVIIDVPNNINNIDCKTPFEVAVMMQLNKLCADLADVKIELASIKAAQEATTNFLAGKKVVTKGKIDLKERYEINVPLETYENFLNFEQKLSTDNYFKKDIYAELKSCVDKDYAVGKSIVKMLKKFLSKDLALQFTAIRSSSINKNKFKFRPTELCTLIEAVITNLRKEKSLSISQDDFNSSLTDVFTNVTRWKS